MCISFPSAKARTVLCPVRHLVLIVVFASLAVAGCEQDKTADLEARIVKLEHQVQAQERKIEILASVAPLSRASVFDSPLQQFFAGPEFWEMFYYDAGGCYNACSQDYQHRLEACEEEGTAEDVLACEIEAIADNLACRDRCRPSR